MEDLSILCWRTTTISAISMSALKTSLNLLDSFRGPVAMLIGVNAYKLSSAPMVELEVPGIIFTIPRSTIDELNPNMEILADQWKTIMEAFFELQGYVNSVPLRYATDVEITGGKAHAGYPIMDVPLETYLFDLSGKSETLTSGEATGCYHEIGHVVQDRRWTSWRLG